MAKKRRTRAQKQRTATHRQQHLEHVLTVEQPKVVDLPVVDSHKQVTEETVESSTTVLNPSAEVKNYQSHDLKLSLTLLAGLVTVQLLIWLLFHFSQLDDHLYDLIKL